MKINMLKNKSIIKIKKLNIKLIIIAPIHFSILELLQGLTNPSELKI